ncbi:MAG: hypothetical protein IJV06_08620 [Bacteroidaceae bacterium]|nr:hypothetical protein [Bacteroidaceae bacterium]
MKTKNIFKTLVAAMLMPAMLLTTACSSEDDAVGTEINNQKGYPLPVTLNVTRQGDAATTRATFNESTKKLEFSTGDKLFVSGETEDAGHYIGTLTWQSGGTFSGTICTENSYSGTADALLSAHSGTSAIAWLFPNGYESRDFISIVKSSQYQATVNWNGTKTFAATKAEAVEQFSLEMADGYNNGFALSPQNAILNFDIRGLASNTEVEVVLTVGTFNVSGTVKTDASGTATFAIGVNGDRESKDLALTVGGTAITLNLDEDNNKTFAAGKVYNINRSTAGHTLSASAVGDIVGSDGKAYAVADKEKMPKGVTAVAMVAYKNGSNGLAIQLNSNPSKMSWSDANAYVGYPTISGSVGTWRLPSDDDWEKMFTGCAIDGDGLQTSDDTTNSLYYISGFVAKITATGTIWNNDGYWSSTKTEEATDTYYGYMGINFSETPVAHYYTYFSKMNKEYADQQVVSFYVLGCLAF